MSDPNRAGLTTERLLALFCDTARRRGVTRDIELAPPGTAPQETPPPEAVTERDVEAKRASTTLLLVSMALTLREEDVEVGPLLQSEDDDLRLASTFFLGHWRRQSPGERED
jgi:hypothetical protein